MIPLPHPMSHFLVKVILLGPLRTLVPSTAKKTAESVSLSPSIDRWQHNAQVNMNMIGACDLCQTKNHMSECPVTEPIATAFLKAAN